LNRASSAAAEVVQVAVIAGRASTCTSHRIVKSRPVAADLTGTLTADRAGGKWLIDRTAVPGEATRGQPIDRSRKNGYFGNIRISVDDPEALATAHYAMITCGQ
jgi:hypothetical protein